jgi:hypothetical protein
MGWRRGVLIGVLLVLSLARPVWSAEPGGGKGFTISPAFQEIKVPSDQDQAQYNLQLTNHTTADQTFRLSVVDFGALDESGGVAFLGAPASELEHRYGLASWMSLEKDAVVIGGGTSAMIIVTIQNRASLSPGGHYGAVLATAVTDTSAAARSTDPRVGIKQVLSSLILAVKEGGGESKLLLRSQMPDGNWWQLPSWVEQRFHNGGNLHVTPRGVTEVRDPLGAVVARGALNDGSKVILPESFRRYITPLIGVAPAWLPGRYAVTTSYRYDGTEQVRSATVHVWYAGMAIVWLVVLSALAAVGLLGWWLWRRRRPS